MKTLILAAFTGVFISPLAADLTSTYETGEVRTTTFTIEETSSLVDVEVLINGELNPMGGNDMQRDQTSLRSGTFTDEVQRATEGQLAAFTRTYSDLLSELIMTKTNPRGDDSTMESTSESELDDAIVQFTLEDGEFVASVPEDETGDEELLEGLKAILPFAELLAQEGVDVDTEWEVEVQSFWDVLNLGGNLAFKNADEDNEDAEIMELVNNKDNIELDGEITATLKSIEDGLATIELSIEMVEYLDLTEGMRALAEDGPEGMSLDIELMDNEKEYEGEGTLIWDIRGGHMVSMELVLELTNIQNMNMSMDMGPEDFNIEQTMTSEGELTASFEVEVTRE